MEYVIPAVLVMIFVGGLVTFLVINATKKSGPVADADEGAPGIGQDDTPLGDTSEHGTTIDDPESGSGGRRDPDAAAHVRRPGEGEGHERLEFEAEHPASERLADRDV